MKMMLWVVSYHNVFEGCIDTTVYTDSINARADFERTAKIALSRATEILDDFRVSKNMDSVTICDGEDDRVAIMCEITKHLVECGTMCM